MEKKLHVKKEKKISNKNLLEIFAGVVLAFMIVAIIDNPAGFFEGILDCFN